MSVLDECGGRNEISQAVHFNHDIFLKGNLVRKLDAVQAYVSFLIPINHFYAKGSSTNQFARTTSHDIFSLCPVVKV